MIHNARATVKFGGLMPGDVVPVDTRDPEIRKYLRAGFLVSIGIVKEEKTPPDEPSS